MNEYYDGLFNNILSYKHVIIFVMLFLESFLLTSFFVPGVAFLLAAGFLWSQDAGNLLLTYAAAMGGILLGDSSSYLVGHYFSSRKTKNSLVNKIIEKKDEVLNASLKYMMLFHFSGYSRFIFPVVFGYSKYSYRKWLTLDFLSASIFVLTTTSFGIFAGVVFNGIEAANVKLNYFLIFTSLILLFWVAKVVKIVRENNK